MVLLQKKIVCEVFLFVGYLIKNDRTTKGRTSNTENNAKHKVAPQRPLTHQ